MTTKPPRPDQSGESDALELGISPSADEWPAGAVEWTVDGPEGTDEWTVDGSAGRGAISTDEVDRASRTYWEAEADAYQAEHGAFLAGSPVRVVVSDHSVARIDHADGGMADAGPGPDSGAGFVWGPEGLTEDEAALLGPVGDLVGRRVLEVGCGAAQCSAWLAQRGVHAVGMDISVNQLRHARRLAGGPRAQPGRSSAEGGRASHRPWGEGPGGDPARAGPEGGDPSGTGTPSDVPSAGPGIGRLAVVAATATALPFADGTFDVAFAAYGAIQFVADLSQLLAEVRRVLVDGGRWVLSVTHPIRWAFPDDPGPAGLTATGSYFDRTPYVERDGSGEAVYAEFHRTFGDYVVALRGAGFTIETIIEPEWPAWNSATWGGWSRQRGTRLPGTLIIGCRAAAVRRG